MASGAPVVATHHAGIGEAVEDGRTGILVPSSDATALTAALRRLVDDPGMAGKLGQEARRVACERFDAMAQSHRLEEKLLEIIAEG
jgi:colanic acid/amylovoran biosynthesis glycosyltransferase